MNSLKPSRFPPNDTLRTVLPKPDQAAEKNGARSSSGGQFQESIENSSTFTSPGKTTIKPLTNPSNEDEVHGAANNQDSRTGCEKQGRWSVVWNRRHNLDDIGDS